MKKETEEMLREAGRELAVSYMQKSINTAETEDQLDNQMFMLRCAAIHIVAALLFNEMKVLPEGNISPIHDAFKDLVDEVNFLHEHKDEMTFHGIDEKDKGPMQ